MKILSRKNPIIKTYASLYQKKKRDETGLFRFEGETLLEEALNFDQPIEAVVVSDTWYEKNDFSQNAHYKLLKQRGIPVYGLTEKDYHNLSGLTSPEGLMVVARYQVMPQKEHQWLVVLEDVQDPGNVGTIIRTADAAGVSQIIYTTKTADPYNEKAIRASMGSIFHLQLKKTENLESFLRHQKQRGALVYGASLQGKTYDLKKEVGNCVDQPWILVVGNEAQGLSPTTEALSHYLYKISMYGHAESLNVSVATGIILFELAKIKNSNEGNV